MKVVIDQNISHRIIPAIAHLFDKLVHVKTENWIDWNDHDIFMSARVQNYDAVITLDEDFNKLLSQHDTPPKVIWLKTGNCSTSRLAGIIVSHQTINTDFLFSENFDCSELYG